MKRLSSRLKLTAVLGNAALIMLGVGIGLGLMELSLRINPNLVPAEVRVDPPVRREKAFVDETYNMKLSDGDLYYWMRGTIAPLPPEKDKVVAHVHLTTDANGFQMLADFATEQNINFLNLTTCLQEEAGTGAELYYSFDTHWNQHGHNLAAETIADYIGDMPPLTGNMKPGK